MKKIIFYIVAFCILLVGSSFGIYYFVDINNYKSDIIQLVKEQTGNDIVINGDMRLRTLPVIALDISRISMPQTHGANQEDALYVKQLILRLKILPLFRKHLEVAAIKMINPEVRYTIYKDGTNNFSKPIVIDLPVVSEKNKKSPEPVIETIPVEAKNYSIQREFINNRLINNFDFSKITAQSGKIIFKDERKNISIMLQDAILETSFIADVNSVNISGNLEFQEDIKVPLHLSAKYRLLKDKYEISGIEVAAGEIKAHGEAMVNFLGVLPESKITVYFEDMDLTPYAEILDLFYSNFYENKTKVELPTEPKSLKNRAKDNMPVWSDEQINFMALRNFNTNLNFKSNKIRYKDTDIGSITIYAYLINGKFTFSVKEAELFGGNINSETSIDVTSSVPKLKQKLNLEEVDFGQLPDNFLVANKFAGKVNGGTMLTSKGSSPKEIISNLSGGISLKAENGYIKDIDLTAMAKNDPKALDIKQAKGQRTEFVELSGDFDVNGGVVKSENLSLNSDVLDFGGQVTINSTNHSLNMMLTPKLKRTKNEKDILGGVKATILVNGTIFEPNFRLEIQTLVEDVVKNPKTTENLVKQLKHDFKDIKNNMKNENDNSDSGFFGDIKNFINGL